MLTPAVEPRGSAPAELFLVDGGPATVGVIASVTRPFCGDCDRVRLTADGQVRNCLFAREESDLRAALRAGATDEEIADRWVVAMARQAARPRHRRPVVPPARPADVGDRRLTDPRSTGPGRRASAAGRPPEEAARTEEVGQESRCSSHASHVLRRSGVCSLGLFQSSAQSAGCWQPLAEQTGGSCSTLGILPASGDRGRERDAGQPRGKLSGTSTSDCGTLWPVVKGGPHRRSRRIRRLRAAPSRRWPPTQGEAVGLRGAGVRDHHGDVREHQPRRSAPSHQPAATTIAATKHTVRMPIEMR